MKTASGLILPVSIAAFALAALALATSTTPDVKERSDAFWTSMSVQGVEAYHFATLSEISEAADVIVVGHIEAIEAGRTVIDTDAANAAETAVHFANAKIRVERSLKGDGVAAESLLTLELLLPTPTALATAANGLPLERTLFFLVDKARRAATQGADATVQGRYAGLYDLASTQGVLREIEGRVSPPADTTSGDFPSDLASRPFDDLLAEIPAYLGR